MKELAETLRIHIDNALENEVQLLPEDGFPDEMVEATVQEIDADAYRIAV